MERIKRVTATEATVERLRDLIISGQLPEGTALRQEELAKRIGVSRTPLREAIARLQSEGFVRLDPHRGATVFAPTPEDLIHIFEIRRSLEPLAGKLAAESRTEEEVEQFAILLSGFRKCKTPKEWADQNEKFHLFLYSMARRKLLLELLQAVYSKSKIYVRILVGEGDAPRAQKEHEAIFEALKAKNGDLIGEILQKHIDGTVRFLLPLLQKKHGKNGTKIMITSQAENSEVAAAGLAR